MAHRGVEHVAHARIADRDVLVGRADGVHRRVIAGQPQQVLLLLSFGVRAGEGEILEALRHLRLDGFLQIAVAAEHGRPPLIAAGAATHAPNPEPVDRGAEAEILAGVVADVGAEFDDERRDGRRIAAERPRAVRIGRVVLPGRRGERDRLVGRLLLVGVPAARQILFAPASDQFHHAREGVGESSSAVGAFGPA